MMELITLTTISENSDHRQHSDNEGNSNESEIPFETRNSKQYSEIVKLPLKLINFETRKRLIGVSEVKAAVTSSESYKCLLVKDRKGKSSIYTKNIEISLSEKKVKLWMMSQENYLVPKDLNSTTNQKLAGIPKRSLLIRKDFSNIKHLTNKQIKDSRSRSLPDSLILDKSQIVPETVVKSSIGVEEGIEQYKNPSDIEKIQRKYSDLKKTQRRKIKSTNIPVSSETQKKNELCSYLQLMDTTDTRNVENYEYRRSVRVLNKKKMAENTEIEETLNLKRDRKGSKKNDVNLNKSQVTNNSTEFSTLKSSTQLKNKPPIFNHVELRKQVDSSIKKFDIMMAKYLERLKIKKQSNSSYKSSAKNKASTSNTDRNNLISENMKKSYKVELQPKAINMKIRRSSRIEKRKMKTNVVTKDAKTLINPNKKRVDYNKKPLKLETSESVKELKFKNLSSNVIQNNNKVSHEKIREILTKNDSLKNLTDKHRSALLKSINFDSCYNSNNLPVQEMNLENSNNSDDLSSQETNLDNSNKSNNLPSQEVNCDYSKITNNLPLQEANLNNSGNDSDESEFNGFNIRDVFISKSVLFKASSTLSKTINTMVVMQKHIAKIFIPEEMRPQIDDSDNNNKDTAQGATSKVTTSATLSPVLSFISHVRSEKPLYLYLNGSRNRKSKVSVDSGFQFEFEEDNQYFENYEKTVLETECVTVAEKGGIVENAYVVDKTLIVVQTSSVSFWTESPLGSILGTDNAWHAKGVIDRSDTGSKKTKTVSETMIGFNNSVAYVELWWDETATKNEITFLIYYFLNCVDDVHSKEMSLGTIDRIDQNFSYVVLDRLRKIVLSVFKVVDNVPTTYVCSYNLASDFQCILSVKMMAKVDYRVRTIHHIENSDNIIIGSGGHKVTLWSMEYGYALVTIDIPVDVDEDPRTLWAKCDRGFLFILQEFENNILKLIAINGKNYTLTFSRTFYPNRSCERLIGACIDKGIFLVFYDKFFKCWNLNKNEVILVKNYNQNTKIFVSGNNVISVTNEKKIEVRSALQYLLSCD